MSIDRIQSASFSNINQTSFKTESAKVQESENPQINIGDSFTHTTQQKSLKNISSSAAGMADKVFNSKGLEKSSFKFHIQDKASGPDGTLFVAYSDYSKKDGNYISAIDSEGKVKWEVSAGEHGLTSIRVGKDGTLYARNESNLTAFHPDGKTKFMHDFDESVTDHVLDANGNSYFRKSSGNELYVVDNEGGKMKLPLKLRGFKPTDIKPQPDGTFLMKEGKKISRVDPSGGELKQTFEFQETDPKLNRSVQDFVPTADGGMMVVARQTTYVNNSHEFDGDLHMGLGVGMGFRRWQHHLPPMDDYRASSTYSTDYVIKYDQSGALQWQTGDIGNGGTPIPLPDNRAIIRGTYSYSDKKADINQINPDGTISVFATLNDGNIDQINMRQSDNHIFAGQSGKLTELGLDGKVLNSWNLDGNKAGMSFSGFESDGKILLQKDTSLYKWDPATDSLTSLTDHNKDYSYKVTMTEAFETEPEGPAKTVEKRESEVIIGGVKLKINKS